MDIELPELPVGFMNDDHAHAEALWREMSAALAHFPGQTAPLAAACRAFLEHNRAHFGREEAAMQRSGFPPYPVHKAEHDRVLALLEALAATVEAGGSEARVRPMIEEEIPAWLLQHVQSMDLVTARWLAAHP
jgi:hemerythrin